MGYLILLSSLLLAGLQLAAAPASLDASLDSLSALHEFREVALSPDHAYVAWTESSPGKAEGERPTHSAYLKELRDGSAAKRIGEPASMVQGLAWSQDGRLAFLSDAESHGQLQLYVVEKPGHGKPRKIGNFEGYLADPHWSHDGKSIALLRIEGITRVPGPTEATAPETGVIASKTVEQRLAIVNVSSGAARSISPADMYVYEFDWSPDEQASCIPGRTRRWRRQLVRCELYAIDAESGAVRHVLKPAIQGKPMQVANVKWSPDGKTLAFIGGLMSDEGVIGGDIYALPAEGGTPRDLTENRKSSPNWFQWSPSSKQILMGENVAGDSAISTLDLASGSTETLWKGAESEKFSGDAGTSAVVRNSFTEPPEVWAGATGKWQQVTRSNDPQHRVLRAQRPGATRKASTWKNGGFDVQGWLLFPQPYDPAKHYPMLVYVHGGPASVARASWARPGLPLELFSQEGYFVFMPNPRGSYGQGENFTRANAHDFGHGDLEDILAACRRGGEKLPGG